MWNFFIGQASVHFAIACKMQVSFRQTEGQVPDPALEEPLNSTSHTFAKQGDCATGWLRSAPFLRANRMLGA